MLCFHGGRPFKQPIAMPPPWSSFKRALSCKIDRTEQQHAVHEPVPRSRVVPSPAHAELHPVRRNSVSWCSRSSRHRMDVIHGNAQVVHKAEIRNSRTLQSASCAQSNAQGVDLFFSPRLSATSSRYNSSRRMQLSKLSGCYDCSLGLSDTLELLLSHCNSSRRSIIGICPHTACNKCGESFSKTEYLDQHYAIHHSVSDLKDGDSARNIVEIIFRTSWLKKDCQCARIERIMKVHNNPKIVGKFEEHRDVVKSKANKLPKKHPRCVADGNELLRFYCTTVSCALGTKGSPSLCCTSSTCSLCQILRFGLQEKERLGIYTTSNSGKAHDSAQVLSDQATAGTEKRAMLVCRVIAGRVKKPFHEDSQHEDSLTMNSYDSVAGEGGPYGNMEDLLVFNPKAVLPCFIVVYEPLSC